MDRSGDEPLTSADAAPGGNPRNTFFVMCACFGLNHAAVTVPVGYATSIFGQEVGNATNAALYGVCMLSSLFLGPLFTSSFGPRNALVVGMFLYVIYVLMFAVGLNFVDHEDACMGSWNCPNPGIGCTPAERITNLVCNCTQLSLGDDFCITNGSPLPQTGAWILVVGGGVIGGVGAGSLWTAQGSFFGAICEEISDATGTTLQIITAQLSSTFAMVFLGQECLWKVLFTVLTKYGKLSFEAAFLIYAALGAVATVGMFFGKDAKPKNSAARAPLCAKAGAALKLWRDPKIWLLSGNNITFGFCAAYLNGYVNSTFTTQALGADFIGFLGAIVCLVATLSSKVYGMVAEQTGTKVPIVVVGSCCFLGIALMSFITVPTCGTDSYGPACWGWGMVGFYVLQGMGRGVYESTNKGIFADFFPGDQGVGAFANCILQNTGSSTIGFIMGAAGVGKQDVWMLIVGSIMTCPMLLLATSIKDNRKGSIVSA